MAQREVFMGLLDIFKKGKKEEIVQKGRMQEIKLQDEMKHYMTRNGETVFEFQEAQPKPGQFYDTTQVIPGRKIGTIDNREVYEVLVTWFNENDMVYLEGRKYTRAIAGIDWNLLQTDPDYAQVVMKELLKKTRVEAYLDAAMKTEDELAEERQDENDFEKYPHGRYVGEVNIGKSGQYRKSFDSEIGNLMHYSADMVADRNEYRAKAEERRKEKIEARKAEIARLQAEIDSYEMDKQI